MLCVEVTVNGTRRCLAAVEDLSTFGAWIAHDRRRDGSATAYLEVTGVSRDESTKLDWIGGTHQLAVDDVVAIRVTEANAADVPAASPYDGVRISELRRARIRVLTAPTLVEMLHSPTFRSLLFWLALAALGVFIYFFSSR